MSTTQRAWLISDLGFGDAGKGTTVDYLARQADGPVTVVRFNGGAQAAHNVVTTDGRQHTFAQLGSASFVPGARTLLSRFMLLDPLALLNEADHLATVGIPDALARLSVDRAALVVTPFQRTMNRLRELARGADRHGSCGLGIGETMADWLAHPDGSPQAGDLIDLPSLRRKLRRLRARKLAELAELRPRLPATEAARRELAGLLDDDLVELCVELFGAVGRQLELVDRATVGRHVREASTLIFEAAQGALLDEWYGFHPYTTWSTTTLANAETVLREADYAGDIVRLGILRAYTTRHGAGPMVSEDPALTATLPERHNGHNAWQGGFRVGHLDLVATRYAQAVVGPLDGLVVTNLDRLAAVPEPLLCTRYAYCGASHELTGLAEHDGELIQTLTVDHGRDLARQARLTTALSHCRPAGLLAPVATDRPDWMERYCVTLESHLGQPIRLASAGPTAAEKWERWTALTPPPPRPPSRRGGVRGAYSSALRPRSQDWEQG